MSQPDAELADTGLRDSIEASVASHTPGPDTDSIVNGATDRHTAEIRKRNDELSPVDRKDQMRAAIRSAIEEAKNKATRPHKVNGSGFEVAPGAPATWPQQAKAEFNELPHDSKMAVLREQKMFGDAVTPIAQQIRQYQEIEQALAPARQVYQAQGMTDAQAVGALLQWERGLRDPQTKVQAYINLGRQLGIDPSMMGYSQPQYEQQPQQQYQQADMAQMTAAVNEINDFARDKPDFSTLRVQMGAMIQAGMATDLADAYSKCGGRGANQSRRRAAAVSPRSGSPAGKIERNTGRSSGGIRGAIMDAFEEARER